MLAWLVVALAVATPTPAVVQVQVTLEVVQQQSGRVVPSGKNVLRATPVGGRNLESAAPLEVSVKVPGDASMTLAKDVVWRFSLASEGWWAAPVTVYVAEADAAVGLRAWSSSFVTGLVKAPSGEPSPAKVKVAFEPPVQFERSAHGALTARPLKDPHGETECALTEGRFRCLLPAAVLDLKLRCRGYISFVRWAQDLKPGGTRDMGELKLVPGASLAGFVTTVDGPADPGSCKVRIKPLLTGDARTLSELARTKSSPPETTVDDHGFFTFEGLPAGMYNVTASQPGFAPVSGRFTVRERTETRAQDTLVLERPLRLRVSVSPPLDSYGKAWGLGILRREQSQSHGEVAYEGAFGEDGTLETNPLSPGRLVITVWDSARSRVLWQEHELTLETTDLFVKLAPVQVSGRVLIGNKPLSADVYFGRRNGAVSVRTESDGDGKFVGALPRGGLWDVQVLSRDPVVDRVVRGVEVNPDQQTGWAEVEIRLPDKRLQGTVVDERGDPVPAASVTALNLSSPALAQVYSREGGKFELVGVEAGSYTLQAEDMTPHGTRESASSRVDVPAEGAPPDVQLVLRRKREIRGKVLGDGEPVAGARVYVFPEYQQVGGAGSEEATTDLSGSFAIDVVAGSDRAVAVVLAPGYAFRALNVDLSGTSLLVLGVTAYGGELELRLPSPIDLRNPKAPKWAVWQDGILLEPFTMLEWARLMGVVQTSPSPTLRFPYVHPANYRLCLLGDLQEVQSALAGAASRQSGCVERYLPPLGRLTLEAQSSK